MVGIFSQIMKSFFIGTRPKKPSFFFFCFFFLSLFGKFAQISSNALTNKFNNINLILEIFFLFFFLPRELTFVKKYVLFYASCLFSKFLGTEIFIQKNKKKKKSLKYTWAFCYLIYVLV